MSTAQVDLRTPRVRTGDEVATDIPRNIRTLLANRALTARDLAALVNMGQGRLSERMTGKVRFAVAEVVDIANAVGVEPSVLLMEPAELVRSR